MSCAEDRSIRVWDMNKRQGVQTVRREADRFWVLAAHADSNLFAAGHDSGLIVFKLQRERPAYAAHEGKLYYIKDRYLRVYEIGTTRDQPLVSISQAGQKPAVPYRDMAYNAAEHAVLLTNNVDGGSYVLMMLPRATSSSDPELKRGAGLAAVWVARNRFAVLAKGRQILMKNLENTVTKKVPIPNNLAVDNIFYAGTGNLLLRTPVRVS